MKLPRGALLFCVLMPAIAPVANAEDAVPFEEIQVTATRTPEPTDSVPASVTVISGEELRARGANDLRTALSLVGGVEISPGGDNGPAGAVPAIWGLREFDAFLLVVDGVPWGGAFNPALTTLDLNNIERIEVMRGAAPVLFGATSFVGVIHIIHYPAGQSEQRAFATVGGVSGNFGTATLGASSVLSSGDIAQSLSANIENREYRDDQTGLQRGHVMYRAGADLAGGHAHFDADITVLKQDPASPVVREGPMLTTKTPLDANHNPRNAEQDENRCHFVGGFERDTALGTWGSTLSFSRTDGEVVRGFLRDVDTDPIADGFDQDRELTDVYLDTHLVTHWTPALELTYGFDWLHGKGEQASRNFEYPAALDGSDSPNSDSLPIDERTQLEDERNFFGLYGQGDWKILPSLDLIVGLRLNHTNETRVGEEVTMGDQQEDERSKTRLSGTAGLSWRVWRQGADEVVLYTDYRNAYKPAAIDFGPEAEAEILAPETAHSYEVGAKGHLINGQLDWDLSGFYMDMRNLVIAQAVNGAPALRNGGDLKFKGGEIELRYHLAKDLLAAATYARHDLRFGNYQRTFNGATNQQLRGNFQELAPQQLGSLGVIYSPAAGPTASVIYAYTGHRFLNQRNTAKASHYEVVDASVGWNFSRLSVHVSGYNLTDRRDPVAESELGDAQYYLLPARSIEFGVSVPL